jgi:hypothetical protein
MLRSHVRVASTRLVCALSPPRDAGERAHSQVDSDRIHGRSRHEPNASWAALESRTNAPRNWCRGSRGSLAIGLISPAAHSTR